MIELDERDIRQISNGRFFRKNSKYFIASVLGSLGPMVLVMYLSVKIGFNGWFGLIPLALFLVSAVLWERKRKRAEVALLEEWRKGRG